MSELTKPSATPPSDCPRLVLDTDVFLALETAGVHAELKRHAPWPIVVTDVVWGELTDYCSPRFLPGMIDLLKALAGGPTELQTDSEEARLFGVMHHPKLQTEGAGELSVVAYTLCHPDAVAVLKDRRAAVRALEEQRGRVLSVFGMLGLLVGNSILAPEVAERVVAKFLKHNNGIATPHWWPAAR